MKGKWVKSKVLVCLCVHIYSCICMCAYVDTCVFVCVCTRARAGELTYRERPKLNVSALHCSPHSCLRHWFWNVWSLPTGLEWLVNKAKPGSSCLCLSSTSMTSTSCYASISMNPVRSIQVPRSALHGSYLLPSSHPVLVL